ncbi:MAG TPA: phosphotransferase family protein [Baekduia sp.]|nr:phosphotransferase family protein [Baekduia sp.]HET6507934.1 phosphotransferase family protein [Baekduia sp.]
MWSWGEDALARLATFLGDRDLVSGPVAARPIGDGHANLTFLVTDDAGRAMVVRRPPPPPIPRGANDMLREARLIEALAGTGVPVPAVLAVGQEGDVLDVPFYVMSYMKGVVFTDATPPALATPPVRRELAEALIDTLAALHAVDWRARGLEDFGRPEDFNARHLARMTRLVAGEDGAPPPAFAPLAEWLTSNVPAESGAAILHNDFRLGNVMLAAAPPGRVEAVLDWELATIGDPLLDVAYFLASYPQGDGPRTPTEDLATALLEDGYPTREELAERYARATGRDLSGLRWHTALVQYKLAALYEHSHRRAVAGVGDPYYADAELVARFLAAGARAAGYAPTAASA